jgi:class 3 adenylate cyclase
MLLRQFAPSLLAGAALVDLESRYERQATAGDGVRGIAVHIGARVSALATASEVLVSSTVRDLVAGSGLQFEDRGSRELKGVPDPWRVLALIDD